MTKFNHVLLSKDLTYAPYHQSRGDGFSGALLIASEVNDPGKRYIIKAAMAHVAACEFMFYKLAAKLKLPVAQVWLISPAKPDEFSYPACAIRYIPSATFLKYDEQTQIEECRLLTNLSFILGDRDHQDFLRDENGDIYKIDHSDCFGIEGTAETRLNPANITPQYVVYQMAKTKPAIGHYADNEETRGMLKSISRMKLEDFSDEFRLINQFCGLAIETHFRYYINEFIGQCRSVA